MCSRTLYGNGITRLRAYWAWCIVQNGFGYDYKSVSHFCSLARRVVEAVEHCGHSPTISKYPEGTMDQ
ncbi:hypothetical protein HZH66_007873 [Vespula vulgaris]|uniref:Uncharacterized protein n=1 Tax=Vespula vulgaris TaxID=7454 RepID=A0A834N4J2_VESVU|nr:hypothetical protein HZH66_007873 [Vespula vulgaris]